VQDKEVEPIPVGVIIIAVCLIISSLALCLRGVVFFILVSLGPIFPFFGGGSSFSLSGILLLMVPILLGILGIIASIGLLRRKNFWRKFTLIILTLSLALILILSVFSLFMVSISPTSSSAKYVLYLSGVDYVSSLAYFLYEGILQYFFYVLAIVGIVYLSFNKKVKQFFNREKS
jgi:hypothetical protein